MTVTCDSASILKAIVAQNGALTVTTAFMVLDELCSGSLVAPPDVDLGVRGRIGVARLRRRTPPPAAQVFARLLTEHDAAVGFDERASLDSMRLRR